MREDWIKCTVDDVIELMKNGSSAKQFNEKIGFPITRIETIWDEKIDLKRVKYIEEKDEALIEKHCLRFGDILLSHINSDSHLGKTAIFKNQTKVLIHGINLLLLRPYQKLDQYFLNYQFKFLRIKGKFIDEAQRAVNQSSINQRKLKRFQIKLAPLPEQRAIVAKIEQLFSELDNGISNLKAAKDKLEIYRQAVLKKAFEGIPLVPFEEIVIESQNGISKRKGTDGRKIKVLRLADITNFEIDNSNPREILLTESELEKYELKKGDLIVIRVNGSKDLVGGIVHVSPKDEKESWAFCDHFIRLKLDMKKSSPKFYYYYFHTLLVRKYIHENMVSSAGQNTVSQTTVKSVSVPSLSKGQQTQIVQEIESRLSVCDNVLANIDEALEKSEALRQSILKQAFEGKLLTKEELEACRNEPDWESAEKLLERIKGGKDSSGKKGEEPVKKPSPKKIHHVEYYKRTLLAAEIVWQLHGQPTLGHLKLQKLIYLCQQSGNMQLPVNFLKQTAGPYDPQMARSIDKQLKNKKWFVFRENEFPKYAPLEKAGEHQADFNKYYSDDVINIQKIIDLFRTAKSEKLEIIATLYACWKEIIAEKALFTEKLLIHRFYEWSDEKSKYSEDRLKKALEWMRDNGIVPVQAKKLSIDE